MNITFTLQKVWPLWIHPFALVPLELMFESCSPHYATALDWRDRDSPFVLQVVLSCYMRYIMWKNQSPWVTLCEMRIKDQWADFHQVFTSLPDVVRNDKTNKNLSCLIKQTYNVHMMWYIQRLYILNENWLDTSSSPVISIDLNTKFLSQKCSHSMWLSHELWNVFGMKISTQHYPKQHYVISLNPKTINCNII